MKFVKGIALAVALVGAALFVPFQAVATEGFTCDEVARSEGSLTVGLTTKPPQLTAFLEVKGGVAVESGNRANVLDQCQELAQFKLAVYKNRRQVAEYHLKTFSDVKTGKLQLTQRATRSQPAVHLGDKVRFSLTGSIWDKDQRIDRIHQSSSMYVKHNVPVTLGFIGEFLGGAGFE